ncbi:hypothetical protein O5698_23310 [Escherichia coli]|nr:hypothetical protein [Escherichia coli]
MTTRINGMALDVYVGGTDIRVKTFRWISATKRRGQNPWHP